MPNLTGGRKAPIFSTQTRKKNTMQTELNRWLKENHSRLNDACGDSWEADLWEDLLNLTIKGYLGTLENIGYDPRNHAAILERIIKAHTESN